MRVIMVILLVCAAFGECDAAEQSPWKLAFYADSSATKCALINTEPQLLSIHMFLVGVGQIRTVAFTAPTPSCWTNAYFAGDAISDLFISLGGTHQAAGIVMSSPLCLDPPVYLGRMSFWGVGSEPCCVYDILPSAEGDIHIIDCQYGRWEIPYDTVTINPDETCPCVAPISNEPTTWGRVKALYH